jgi:hypothetical protein
MVPTSSRHPSTDRQRVTACIWSCLQPTAQPCATWHHLQLHGLVRCTSVPSLCTHASKYTSLSLLPHPFLTPVSCPLLCAIHSAMNDAAARQDAAPLAELEEQQGAQAVIRADSAALLPEGAGPKRRLLTGCLNCGSDMPNCDPGKTSSRACSLRDAARDRGPREFRGGAGGLGHPATHCSTHCALCITPVVHGTDWQPTRYLSCHQCLPAGLGGT